MTEVFRATEDIPGWHEHVATGRIARCPRKDCTATWPVFCHGGQRRYCERCARALRRISDREAKRMRRAQARRNKVVYEAYPDLLRLRIEIRDERDRRARRHLNGLS